MEGGEEVRGGGKAYTVLGIRSEIYAILLGLRKLNGLN